MNSCKSRFLVGVAVAAALSTAISNTFAAPITYQWTGKVSLLVGIDELDLHGATFTLLVSADTSSTPSNYSYLAGNYTEGRYTPTSATLVLSSRPTQPTAVIDLNGLGSLHVFNYVVPNGLSNDQIAYYPNNPVLIPGGGAGRFNAVGEFSKTYFEPKQKWDVFLGQVFAPKLPEFFPADLTGVYGSLSTLNTRYDLLNAKFSIVPEANAISGIAIGALIVCLSSCPSRHYRKA